MIDFDTFFMHLKLHFVPKNLRGGIFIFSVYYFITLRDHGWFSNEGIASLYMVLNSDIIDNCTPYQIKKDSSKREKEQLIFILQMW